MDKHFVLTYPGGTTQPATGQPLCLRTRQCDVLYGIFRSNYENGNEPVVDYIILNAKITARFKTCAVNHNTLVFSLFDLTHK